MATKLMQVKTSLTLIMSLLISFHASSDSFQKVEGQYKTGQYSITCEPGNGWRKCGAPKKECKADNNHKIFETRVEQCKIKSSRCSKNAVWGGNTLYDSRIARTIANGLVHGRQMTVGNYIYSRYNGGSFKPGAKSGYVSGLCREPR